MAGTFSADLLVLDQNIKMALVRTRMLIKTDTDGLAEDHISFENKGKDKQR